MRCIRSIALAVLLFSASGAVAQDWPQWRGPNRDNKVVGFVAPKSWPKELTKKWTVGVGVGEAWSFVRRRPRSGGSVTSS